MVLQIMLCMLLANFTDMEEAYAVLAVDFEHFFVPNWQNFSTLMVKIRLFHFFLPEQYIFI